ncbi:disease resistance protein RPV1-like isoform X1 [Eucalyptus grandis]|uniref:disease resistance protein RPV1-like isoform X1 n=1 Tax=Eucalyptus grandis TaxID=71139 RepID=UPI00192E9A04|nr:disease resistance protein RPV1-like isoform X1 [Eucalyptus grandis]
MNSMAESEAEMHLLIKKRKTNASGNAEGVDTGASGSMTVPTETDFIDLFVSDETNNNAPTGNRYDVFLSFRGLDTRHGFTDHLYHGLFTAGIDTFRDDDELRHGENIKPELLAAIRNSKISIPILSVNYGTSSWCLDELVQIMECKNSNKQIVLPIFYKVKPADVRYQTGRFGEAFHERESRLRKRSSFDPTTLEKWKSALDEVSTLKGYEALGYEAELVKSIVRRVLSELKKKFELVISENLVGIDNHVSRVMESMDNKSHATLFVGIHGMGGIGKTTLAKVIYNKLSNQFEHRSFIADVRESWKRNGIHYLQNKLVSDILNQKNEVHDQDEGTNFISSKFKGKKVLILLDDVDNVVQLKHLAGNHDWFYPGSKIIITSRNKKILKQIGVDYIYDHREMDDVHSLILFSKHAFRRDSPSKDFKDLTHEVVSLTGGLPLSLEVLGSLLCGEKPEFWRGTIDKLKIMPCKEVQETLKISYEALDNEQKQIFLDISCFFIGTDSRIASYMWDACCFFPKEGIEVLRFMSLIKIGDDHKLQMHDHLRDLGRTIVRQENPREPQKHSRLWDPEEALKVLKRNKGTDKIEAIDLIKSEIAKRDDNNYTAEQFKNLTSLRFLFMEGAHLSGDFEDSMEELKWLQWQECPTSFEVNNFHMQELAVLELHGSEINEKWGGWSFFKMAKKLKYLDLSGCWFLENTDFLSAFEKLEVLILIWCTRLKRIDASTEDTEGLLHLEMGS